MTQQQRAYFWRFRRRAVKLGLERRIRLNCIGPCQTRTAFMDEQEKLLPEGFLDEWPYPSLGRIATAEDQAWPLILLNSPAVQVLRWAHTCARALRRYRCLL